MTIPRPTSATTLSSVCETIVPTTVGRWSRGRPGPARHDQRARGLAEPRGQRGGHEHADERALQRVGAPQARLGQRRGAGSRATPRRARPSRRTSGRGRAAPRSAWPAAGCRRSGPGRCAAARAGPGTRRRAPARPIPALRAAARRRSRPSRLEASRLGRRRSAGRRGPRSAGTAPRNTPARSRAVGGARHGDGVLVGLEDLAGDRRPGVALRVRARLDGHAPRAARAPRRGRAASRPARWRRRAGRARRRPRRARRRGSRGCRRRRPACRRRRPRSAPCRSSRRPATARRAGRPRPAPAAFSASETLPSTLTPCVPSSSSGSTSSRSAPTTMSSTGDVVAQRLEGAQQDGQPLALDGLADEGEAQRRALRPRRERGQLGRARRRRWG